MKKMKKNKPELITDFILRNGEHCIVDRKAYDHIRELYNEIAELNHENSKLRHELDTIKPIIETGKLEPAVSAYCKNCRFAIKSSWNNHILGCCRNSVCNGFMSEE